MTNVLKTLAIITVLCCSPLLTSHCSGQMPSDAVKKVQETISSQGGVILRVAHPLGKLKDARVSGYRQNGQKHIVSLTIDWIGKEDRKEREYESVFDFKFSLTNAGKVDEMEIAVARDSSPHRPFKGADIAASVFRMQVKKRLEKLVDGDDIIKKLKTLDGDGLLAVWIKYSDSKD